MANVIIGIHGLDNKPSKDLLEKWWKEAMLEGLKKNGFSTSIPEFELVYWADILYDHPLSESTDNPEYLLDEKYVEAPKVFEVESHSTRKKVVDFINRQLNQIFLNDDLSLNYSFITDTIVGKLFKDLDIYFNDDFPIENTNIPNAKELINQRLVQVLEQHKNDQIMLISHSMGSIIAYDVLNFRTSHIPINTFVTIGSPLGLPIIISKIAAEQMQKDVNHMCTPNVVTHHWYNFSDILDKVALNYNLNDDFSENSNAVKPIDFLVVNNYEINGIRNPHKSYGYLRTPEFSKVLNDFILSEKLTIKERINRIAVQLVKRIGIPKISFRKLN